MGQLTPSDLPKVANIEPLSPPGKRVVIPRVLVLLAAYNGSRWIAEQIQSILSQDDVGVTIVVRDDNSTDGTQSELLRFNEDPRIILVLDDHRSGSAAQNFLTLIGTQSAEGFDFVALSDQDDVWYPDKLRKACQSLEEAGAFGYSSATLAAWEDGKSIVLKPSGAPNSSDFLLEGAGQGCTFVLSSSLYQRIRAFLLTYPDLTKSLHFHDWAIYALARSWNLLWIFDPTPSMIYRQHAGNDTGARGSFRSAMKRLKLVRNGWYQQQLRLVSALCSTAAPANKAVAAWNSALERETGLRRRIRLAQLSLRAGRRRLRDKVIVVAACLAGWI